MKWREKDLFQEDYGNSLDERRMKEDICRNLFGYNYNEKNK